MTRRTYLYVALAATVGIFLGSVVHLGWTWWQARQIERWRIETILRSTGDLPFAVLEEIDGLGRLQPYQILALGWAESRGDAEAVSEAGARGWLQVMPEVAAKYNYTAEDMHDPVLCARVGSRHFAEMLKAFKGNELDAVAAYNTGESGWKRCMNERVVPRETSRLQSRYTTRARQYRKFLREGVIE